MMNKKNSTSLHGTSYVRYLHLNNQINYYTSTDFRLQVAICIQSQDGDIKSASVTWELEQLRPLSGECCIYRVPEPLRRLNNETFTPQVVSIGPIHCGNEKLKAMEEHKKRFLKDFLTIGEISVEECIGLIQENETKLRNCYAETIGLSSEEFVKIMLLDATFIIMVFLRISFNAIRFLTSEDRLFGKPKMMRALRYDMLMLENQIPFFILEDIFNLSKTKDFLQRHFDLSNDREFLDEELAMTKLAGEFLNSRITGMTFPKKKNYSFKVDHLLDFLRICCTPSDSEWSPQKWKSVKTINTPSVKELHQAGIKFKVGSKENIFDINFKDGILEIPPFRMEDSSETLFRNLQAYEQCHCLDNLFAGYIFIMDQLIKTPKDVESLIESEIIEDLCSAKGISTVFHDLGIGVLIDPHDFRYSGLIEDLNKYYRAPSHKWKATLRQEYFKTPWTTISVIAAGILLILTTIQTVYSILQFKKS